VLGSKIVFGEIKLAANTAHISNLKGRKSEVRVERKMRAMTRAAFSNNGSVMILLQN
jgi:hypothetical protein